MYLQGCEREVAEAEKQSSDEFMKECLLRLSWALVHSRRPEDVQRGIAMLEGSCINSHSPHEKHAQTVHSLTDKHAHTATHSLKSSFLSFFLQGGPYNLNTNEYSN